MASCEVCGNEYVKAFEIRAIGPVIAHIRQLRVCDPRDRASSSRSSPAGASAVPSFYEKRWALSAPKERPEPINALGLLRTPLDSGGCVAGPPWFALGRKGQRTITRT